MKTYRKPLALLALVTTPLLLALALAIPNARAADAAKMGPLRHIVLLDFKDSATPEQLKGLGTAAEQLKKDVDVIVTLELGENLASNTRNDGYTHCLFVTFADEAGLKVYGPHAGHETFKKALLPLVEKVLVFDYLAN